MAAFSFPQNPTNGQTEKNPATGITYVFSATPAPGKWEVQMQSSDDDYVNVTGDTMTGPLDIVPSTTIPDSARDATLMVKASPFTQDPGNETYISRVFEAKTNEDHNIFGIRNSDATNLPITQGRLSSITAYAADFLTQPSLNSITADDFPSDGLRAGFRIGGRQQGGTSGNVLDCTYFPAAGTQVNYYGDMLTDNSLVTKAYVDSAGNGDFLPLTGGEMSGAITFDTTSGDAINVNSGKWKVAFNGTVNQDGGISVNSGNITVGSGNLTVKSTSGTTGRIYVKNGDTTNITIYPDGSIESAAKLTFSGTSNNIIRAYGSASKSLLFKVSNDVSNPGYTDVFSIGKSSFTVEGGTGEGTNVANTVTFTKKRGNSTSDDFVIEGATNDEPTTADATLFSVHRNQINDATNADAINYYGRVIGDDNIQTKTSVQALITDAFSSTDFSIPTDVSFTNLVVANSIAGTSGAAGGNLDIHANAIDINAGGRMTLPNYINASSAPTPTIQLLSGSDALIFRSDTKVGLTDTSGRIGYIGQGGLAMYKPYYVFGGGVAGSDNPDTAGANNQISFNNATSEYAIFQSKGYNQNGYQIFADTSSGTPKKIMNWLLSADGTKGYLNCYYAPQGPNGLVRLSDLATGVVGAVNTYSVSGGEEGTDEATYHVSNHNIPGQCSFAGLQGAGAGFNLIGRTADQPTNPSAVLLRASHFSSAAAQLEYFGDTTGTDNCLQTKESVAAMLSDAVAGIDNSTLYGQVTVKNGADGGLAQFRLRNSTDNKDTFKINNDGSVNSYGSYYNFIGTHGNCEISNTASNLTDTILSFNVKSGGTKITQLKILSDSVLIYSPLDLVSGGTSNGEFTVSTGNLVANTGQLKLHTNTGGATIIMDGTAAVGGITVAGNAGKTFKIFAGETLEQTTKQVFAISQTAVTFGGSTLNPTYTFSSSSGPTVFNFTESLALKFNNVVNPITLSQGSIENVNTLVSAPDATGLDLESLGGTNQFVELKGTNSNGDPFTVGKFTATNTYISTELDIYGNTGTNTRIYSYGSSRGLEIWAADFKTSKGNAKISAKFEDTMISLDTEYITWDNGAQNRAGSSPQNLYLRLGVAGTNTQYPKVNFSWATETGITNGMTMQYTGYEKVPNVTLNTDAHVTAHAAPSTGDHLCNKTYVDNKVSSVSVSGTTQSVGTFTLTLDGTGTTPSTKQTVSAHYRKIGHIVHIVAHNANIDLTGYAGSSIRMTGLPFQPDDDIPVQIGHIHAVNLMVNNYHADDDQVAVVMHDSTYGSHFRIFAGQVTNESTYIPNQTGASMTISATYIAES